MQSQTLFLVITGLTILSNLVSVVTKERVQGAVYAVFLKLFLTEKYNKLMKLKSEQLAVNKERNAISAQDNYAKWTKLNRKYDALAEQIKKEEHALSGQKSSIDSYVSRALQLLTTLPINALKLWYARRSLFYTRPGTFPWVIDALIINIPFLARGSVGIYVWCFCVNRVFWILVDFVKLLTEPGPLPPSKEKVN
ncbi:hypothetical protein KL925_002513 [Ogataea polymorpha]|uniref:uncharacterized protein n=1 Tax=Ogataea polymorpha TaxID=460523 RepID=UPI0007F462AB|nr:uncharacterized protein OGAPODRAFT_91919 [Ogataea polymorpha]KAG7894659.1 hypothetical protein KL908_002031 [Ogataea polymorpha]KAG7899747.1 hypothetical protein KL935_003288 [Ogataea polymorpha]KAG7927142.1 hypothetical protein KL925_002513 [Ogataea polymorpha]KAG7934574.1 hypothetical protein KL934_002500 [Ogataea polymorpha]OBA18435.1 hypothetical protein OGAPODRAFT_91919 [Ogataea polymorpha]